MISTSTDARVASAGFASKLMSFSLLTNPGALSSFAAATGSYVSVDQGFGLPTMLGLAASMRLLSIEPLERNAVRGPEGYWHVRGVPLPLPTKYRLHFGEPMYFYGDPDEDDTEINARVESVREAIQGMLGRGLAAREHIFW